MFVEEEARSEGQRDREREALLLAAEKRPRWAAKRMSRVVEGGPRRPVGYQFLEGAGSDRGPRAEQQLSPRSGEPIWLGLWNT